MPDPTLKDVMLGVKELREEFDKKSPNFEKIDKIEAVLASQEEKNQQLLADKKTAEKSADELKERMDVLETELARSGGAGDPSGQRSGSSGSMHEQAEADRLGPADPSRKLRFAPAGCSQR